MRGYTLLLGLLHISAADAEQQHANRIDALTRALRTEAKLRITEIERDFWKAKWEHQRDTKRAWRRKHRETHRT